MVVRHQHVSGLLGYETAVNVSQADEDQKNLNSPPSQQQDQPCTSTRTLTAEELPERDTRLLQNKSQQRLHKDCSVGAISSPRNTAFKTKS